MRALRAVAIAILAAAPAAHAEPVEMTGMYRYIADSATFSACSNGLEFPVSNEGDSLSLERAYLQARPGPGDLLLVRVEAEILMRPGMEGNARKPALIINRFIQVHPDQECDGSPRARLRNTYWQAVELENQIITLPDNVRRPFFVFRMTGNVLHGQTGCNRLIGSYTVTGDRLEIRPVVAERNICPREYPGEDMLVTALENANRYIIRGQRLELFRDNEQLGLFNARHPKLQ
jgi:heat shock protein HslJ